MTMFGDLVVVLVKVILSVMIAVLVVHAALVGPNRVSDFPDQPTRPTQPSIPSPQVGPHPHVSGN